MKTRIDGFSYFPGFLSGEEQSILLQELRDLDYKHDVFRGQRLKREYVQFGYAYIPTSHKLNPVAPMPEFLAALVAKGLPYCPEGALFNQCIITCYPKGAGVGWHTDAHQFGEWIMAISLGGEVRLQFRPNGSVEVSYEVKIAPGSLYVMWSQARWEYQHRVVPVKSMRYSLTFRYVAEGGVVRRGD